MPKCRSAKMLQCQNVVVPKCRSVNMSQCRNVAATKMSKCQNVGRTFRSLQDCGYLDFTLYEIPMIWFRSGVFHRGWNPNTHDLAIVGPELKNLKKNSLFLAPIEVDYFRQSLFLNTTPFVSLPSGRRFGSRATISTLILLSETWRFWWLAPVVQETVGVEVRGREAPKCVWCDKFELCTTFLCLQRCLGALGVTPRPAGSVGWCWGPGGTPGTTGGRNIARWGVWLCSEQILGS